MPHRRLEFVSTEAPTQEALTQRKLGFQYDPKISLGTIVETLTLVLVAGSAYVALSNADVKHDEQIRSLTADVARVDIAQKTLQNDVKADLRDIKDAVVAIRLQQAANTAREAMLNPRR